jgi:hypothetical protein
MQIPVTLKVKDTKAGRKIIISYMNEKKEWVDSMFSDERTDKNGNKYRSSVIDTTKEAWKPTPKVEEDVDPEEFFKDMTEKEAKQEVMEEVIGDDDLPF